MSPGDRAEGVARLRRVIAEIEAEAGRPSDRLARRLPLARAFNSALGGGLADDALHEIAPAQAQDGAAAMGFALALAARFLNRRPASALLVSEGFAAEELGALYGPGLVAHGAPLSRLVFVRAPDAALAFWAMEEALKCGAPAAVVGEIWNLKGYGLAASRRLLLAARKGKVPALLILASAYGQAERLSSAAETRFEIAAAPSARIPAAAGPDLPGPFACGVRLVKARLGVFVAVDSPSKDGRSSERPIARPRRTGVFEAPWPVRKDGRLPTPYGTALSERGLRRIALSRRGLRRMTRNASFVSNGEARTWLLMTGLSRTSLSRTWDLTTRRFLSLWLPRLATDRARRLGHVDKGAPLVAVAKVDNAQRLVSIDAEAARLGLSIGLSLPDARARFPFLIAVEAEPEEEVRLLERLCDWCSRFTPLAALDGRDGLMLDISGIAHLFGGEAALIEDCRARLVAQGITVAVGAAGNPRAAWALARFSQVKTTPEPMSEKAFAKLFHDLPLAALGLDGKTAADMARAGLRRIGDIALRPRAPITARFGAVPIARLDALKGLERSSIAPRFPPPDFCAERRFASPILTIEAIEASLRKLADDLVALIERQAKGARRIELASIASMGRCAASLSALPGRSTKRARSCGSSPKSS